MTTIADIRDTLELFDQSPYANVGANELADAIRELLDEPTNVQALALARLIRDHRANHVDMRTHVFDLPEGTWHATLNGTFVCGIAPDGSVSS